MILMGIVCLIPACSDSVDPGDAQEYASSDYIWNRSRSPFNYVAITAGLAEAHSLVFSLNSGSIRDERLDASKTVVASTMLSMSGNNGNYVLGGCGDQTLFQLPADLRFADHFETLPGPQIRAARMLSLDGSTILVAEQNGGLYRCDVSAKRWSTERFPAILITALCMDSAAGNRTLFAGTRDNGIYMRRESDSSWLKLPAPPGVVQDIEADVSRGVFAVIDRSLYYSRPPFTTWRSFPVQPGGGDLTDIAIVRYSANEAWLFTASEQSGIGEMLLLGEFPVRFSMVRDSPASPIHRISGARDAAFPVVAAGSAPAALRVAPQFGLWLSIPVSFSINDLCQSRNSPKVFIATDNGIMSFDGVACTSGGMQGHKVISVHVSPSGNVYCGTDSGTYQSRDDGASWSRLDMSSTATRSRTGLILMPARLWKGLYWDAARLTQDGITDVRISGRVIEHLDELRLPKNLGAYTDVLVVRYAQEAESGVPLPGRMYWTCYFARSIGLVLIDRNDGNGTVSQRALPAQP